jgi:hypothetical protein
MRDPKVFAGKECNFTLYEGDARPGVIVRFKGAPLDHGQWVPMGDLLAFLAWREAPVRGADARPYDDGRHGDPTGAIDLMHVAALASGEKP